ncbi:hypothetical protein Syun_007462 [Stephania yunnanensis]|uniref:Retinoblastoma-related protein n=1 Tax=Stephania yunnanensis TaxID=152371 RepID=A0AAP0KYM7_9MAGN
MSLFPRDHRKPFSLKKGFLSKPSFRSIQIRLSPSSNPPQIRVSNRSSPKISRRKASIPYTEIKQRGRSISRPPKSDIWFDFVVFGARLGILTRSVRQIQGMEEVKPSISPITSLSDDGGSGAAIEARFAELCKTGLLLDENLFGQAMNLFRESKHLLMSNMSVIGSGTPEEIERFWFAFVVFAVKRLNEGNATKEASGSGSDCNEFSLCQILKATKLNAVDFFKEMPQFFLKAGPIVSNLYGTDWEKRLEAKELQANFVHLSLLSKPSELSGSFIEARVICRHYIRHKDFCCILKLTVKENKGFSSPQSVLLGKFKYYKRAYREFFLSGDSSSKGTTSVVPDYHRFGWLMFLALRVHSFSRFKDLVTCTNGLVSILAILILHVPVRFRNFSTREHPRFVRKDDRRVDLLASLCNIYDTSEDELRKTMEKANGLIVEILKKKPCSASEIKTENLNNIVTDGLTYFEDLLEESSLPFSLVTLERDYDDAMHDKCELDERVFINDEDSLLGTGSLSGGALNITSSKRKFDAMASPVKTITSPLSPPRSPASPANCSLPGVNGKMAAPTPVTTAMTTAKWLRTMISPLPSKPSAELERFLSLCDKDISNDVTRRAHIILEAIFPRGSLGERCIAGSLQSTNLMDSIWAEQRRTEALKLYYRVLEAMCKAEAQILHATNLTSLLTNERFHRCMLACSAELVLATHKTVTMLFPVVLERTSITAFDLSKVIESFIRHEESLPRELRRHLNSLEERLLESMVWEKGSSLYNSLIVARPALATEINRLGLLAEPMMSLDSIAVHNNITYGSFPPLPSMHKHETPQGWNGDIRSPKRVCHDLRSALVERNSFTSPVKDRLLNGLKSKYPPAALQSVFASPTRPNPAGGGETCAETGINIFFSKIMKLAAVRINGLVERLKQTQHIILCSLYGVAKISQLNLTFREIVYNYRKQPQCKPQVFRSIFVDGSSRHNVEHVDIITFYNDVFIPIVKPLLVNLGAGGASPKPNRLPESSNHPDGPCPGSPRVSSFPSVPDMSPKKVSAVHNVYVSPLRSSKMDALITQSSRSYYACVGESTHAYQSPSKDLTAINDRLNGKKVNSRLNFDDVGLVSDSLVVGSLYHQNGTCASSSGAATLNPPLKSEQHES